MAFRSYYETIKIYGFSFSEFFSIFLDLSHAEDAEENCTVYFDDIRDKKIFGEEGCDLEVRSKWSR